MKKFFCDVCGAEFVPSGLDDTYDAREACPDVEDVCPICTEKGRFLSVSAVVLKAWQDAVKCEMAAMGFSQVPDMDKRTDGDGRAEAPAADVCDETESLCGDAAAAGDDAVRDKEPVYTWTGPVAEDSKGCDSEPDAGWEDSADDTEPAICLDGHGNIIVRNQADEAPAVFAPEAPAVQEGESAVAPVKKRRRKKSAKSDAVNKSAAAGPGSHWGEKRRIMTRLTEYKDTRGLGAVHELSCKSGVSDNVIRSMLRAEPHPIDVWYAVDRGLDAIDGKSGEKDGADA